MNIRLYIIPLALCLLCIPFVNAEVKAGKVNELSLGEYKALVHDYITNPNSWVYKGKQNAVIDFSATWCGPCKRLAPILDDLAKEYSGKIMFYKVDIDDCRELSQAYGVTSVPTMLFCPADGSIPTAITGAYPRDEIIRVIDYVFNK